MLIDIILGLRCIVRNCGRNTDLSKRLLALFGFWSIIEPTYAFYEFHFDLVYFYFDIKELTNGWVQICFDGDSKCVVGWLLLS